jgi:hypothetical protein
MWDGIAYKTMGSELFMNALIENNLKYKEIYIFPAGITLTIPAVTAKPSPGLPPWKRG